MSNNTFFKDYIIKRKLTHKENVLLLSKNDKKYIIKFRQNSKLKNNILLSNIFNLSSLKYFGELSFFKALSLSEKELFNHPKLIETDDKTYFIIEYIAGNEGNWNPDFSQKKIFINALIEFQLSINKLEYTSKTKFFHFLFKPIGATFRLSLTNGLKYLGFMNAIKTMILVTKILIKNQNQDIKFLLHRDLIPWATCKKGVIKTRNLIFDKNDKIYFIDFELPVWSRKFFLIDMVDLAFNIHDESIDWEWLNQYILTLENEIDLKKVNISDQIRIALLRNVLSRIIQEKWRDEYKQFFLNTLLSDSKFYQWLDMQIYNSHYQNAVNTPEL